MKRFSILIFVLAASFASAATPSLRVAPPVVADSMIFRFHESWDLVPASLGEITGKYGYFSPPVALSLESDGTGPCGNAYHQIYLERGKLYAMSAWVNGDKAGNDVYLVISISNEFFSVRHSVTKSQIATGWQHIDLGVVAKPEIYPDDTNLYLGAETRSSDAPKTGTGRWLVGQIEIREVESMPDADDRGLEPIAVLSVDTESQR